MPNELQPFVDDDGVEQDSHGGMMEVAQSRAAQEVQAAMVVAQRFPRDIVKASTRINNACRRLKLAQNAFYTYPKGGTQITGASIRLAETMAQCWGNIDFGIVELEQKDGVSTVMSYAWDLETNTRQCKIFNVSHQIKAYGKMKTLTDPREIYELTANQGARRLRACILGIIPADIQEEAIEICNKTLAGNSTIPLIDRAKSMIVTFNEFGVTQEMIETRIGHKAEAINETELIKLRGIFTSLKDGASTRENWFSMAPESNDAGDLSAGKKTTSKKKITKKTAKPVDVAEAAAIAETEAAEAGRAAEFKAAQDKLAESRAADVAEAKKKPSETPSQLLERLKKEQRAEQESQMEQASMFDAEPTEPGGALPGGGGAL